MRLSNTSKNGVQKSKDESRASDNVTESELKDEMSSDAVSVNSAEEDSSMHGTDEEEEEVENSEVDQDDDEDEEEGDDFPKKKKSKNSKHADGSEEFSSAINAILSSHLKAYDRKDPIMARNKKVLKQTESAKIEAQAKRAILAEKKKMMNKSRKKDLLPKVTSEDDIHLGESIRSVLEKETRLRKIAQKGAVRLFNAIISTQANAEKELQGSLSEVKNNKERQELLTEVSKEKFLDLVKAAGQDS